MSEGPETITSVPDLAEKIRQQIGESTRHIIGVDGFMATKKTFYSKSLAKELNSLHVEVDGSLEKGIMRPYRVALRMDDLKERMSDALQETPILIVEGLCLLDVLDDVGLQPDTLVYIKRLSNAKIWQDELHWEDYLNGRHEWNALQISAFDYHSQRSPHEAADFIFEWIED